MSEILTITLFGSTLYAFIALGVFLILCELSDIYENGFFAFGTLIVVSVLYYFWGSFQAVYEIFTPITISTYLLIGLVYSFIRTYISGRKLGEKLKTLPEASEKNYRNKDTEKADYIDNLKGNVFRWWFMWPLSLLNWLFTDLIKDTWNLVYSKMNRLYNNILELGIKSIK